MQPLVFQSEYIPEIKILVITDDSEDYEDFKPYFDQYGYGFLIPDKGVIVLDGEFLVQNPSSELLKFIEAHEIAHVLLNHTGARNDEDEMDADLGAFLLLNSKNRFGSIKLLLRHFKERHGVAFDKNLLDRVKNQLSDYVD
jgi:Zn-dependent peptidase ImmA (M78 family)